MGAVDSGDGGIDVVGVTAAVSDLVTMVVVKLAATVVVVVVE